MQADKQLFDKIMALAMDPGATDGEALTALSVLRKLVRRNPELSLSPPQARTEDASVDYRVTGVAPFWLTIMIDSLSEEAYRLGLRSRFTFDYSRTPIAFSVRCDGEPKACEAFSSHVEWLVSYVNTQPREPAPAFN